MKIYPFSIKYNTYQALEAIVLRCPNEATPYLSSFIQISTQYIKYDPNYAEDDEDEDMADPDEDDEDDDAGDE